MYGAAFELKTALDYDFEQERNFIYSGLSLDRIAEHLAYFVSRLWQIHAFAEGNTRTTAVFAIKYLQSMGFKVSNDIFAKNSRYFRNALVRANYKNLQKGIDKNPEFLEKFFRNMLLGEHNELKNSSCIWISSPKSQRFPKKKQAIEFAVEKSSFNKIAKRNLSKFIRGVEPGEIFGVSRVREIVGCGPSAASSALKKLQALELIVPISGHGKGKFRFKEWEA